jgi:hypothetical protein
MVHALEEIRRTLIPDGVLIDLRPLAIGWPVEVTSSRACVEAGRLTDLPAGLADDEAANHAFMEAARRGLFERESEQSFPFFYSWETPDEMRQHIQEKWEGFLLLEDQVFSAAQKAWAASDADRRVRVRLKMLLTRWRKR